MKAKAFQVKKDLQKVTHKHIEKTHQSGGPQHSDFGCSTNSWKNTPKKQKLGYCAIVKFSIDIRLTVKKPGDKTFVFSVCFKANKQQIKQLVKKLKSYFTGMPEVMMETISLNYPVLNLFELRRIPPANALLWFDYYVFFKGIFHFLFKGLNHLLKVIFSDEFCFFCVDELEPALPKATCIVLIKLLVNLVFTTVFHDKP
ncbi:hypothetical protein STEG23_033078 [Scotinomys teguina]